MLISIIILTIARDRRKNRGDEQQDNEKENGFLHTG